MLNCHSAFGSAFTGSLKQRRRDSGNSVKTAPSIGVDSVTSGSAKTWIGAKTRAAKPQTAGKTAGSMRLCNSSMIVIPLFPTKLKALATEASRRPAGGAQLPAA